MTATKPLRRFASRRVALAAAGVGAVVVAAATIATPTETVAAFADNVWAGAGFTAGGFSIRSAESFNGTYQQKSVTNPQILTGSANPGTIPFTTPINLAPGTASYAAVFLQTTPGTTKNATVSVQAPFKRSSQDPPVTPDPQYPTDENLWNTHLTFGARAMLASSSSTCNESVFTSQQGVLLFSNGTKFTASAASANSFTLAAAAGNQFMVCFRFHLATSVTSSTNSNGKSIYPVWIFNGTPTP